MKGLPGLIRVAQWTVDEQRRKLADIEKLADKFGGEIEQIEADIEREGKEAGEDIHTNRAFSAFLQGSMVRRDKLKVSIDELQPQIRDAQDALAEAFRELKSYEIAQARQEQRAARTREMKDRAKMDEVALGMYRRKAG